MAAADTLPVQSLTVLPADMPPLTLEPPNANSGNSPYNELLASVKAHGIMTPIFITDKGIVLSGHYRLWAAVECGKRKVPVRRVKDFAQSLDSVG